MIHSKDIKKLDEKITETEFTKELFLIKKETADAVESAALERILPEVCAYLDLLYDKKEALLQKQISESAKKASARHQIKFANILSAGKGRRR